MLGIRRAIKQRSLEERALFSPFLFRSFRRSVEPDDVKEHKELARNKLYRRNRVPHRVFSEQKNGGDRLDKAKSVGQKNDGFLCSFFGVICFMYGCHEFLCL